MDFAKEIQRLLLGLLLVFCAVTVSAAYWAITGDTSILQREDNPRLVEAEATIRRGSIYDRNGDLLVQSVVDSGVVTREYLHETMHSALGYFSLRYGVGGAEAAYDSLLRGDESDANTYLTIEILHRPQVGADIRLTLDVDVQAAIVEAMDNQRGAAVVLRVRDGAVLSMVSQPTFNPNTLDADWERLVEAEGNPFFNRVLQGQYQAGGMMQTPLIASAIITQKPLTTTFSDATNTVTLDDVVLDCAIAPPQTELTLAQAYTYACPAPFDMLINTLNRNTITETIAALQLENPPTLENFVVTQPPVESTPDVEPDTSTLRENLLGQGDNAINPLGMATLTSAIINDGNAPTPHVLNAVREPNSDAWIAASSSSTTIPMMTDRTARRLRDLMVTNMSLYTENDIYDDVIWGGHVAHAYSGEETLTWFIGFVRDSDQNSYTIAVVLEDTTDSEEVVSIAEAGLLTAIEQISPSAP